MPLSVSVCRSAALHPPAAEPAPHRLLTFPPAVARGGPEKTPLSFLPQLQYTPHGRPRELASRGPDFKALYAPGFERIELRTL